MISQSFGLGFGALMLGVTIWRFWGGGGFLFWCIEGLILLLAVYHLIQYYNIKKEYQTITRRLEKEKEDLVWVYTFESEVMPYGVVMFRKIYFCFGDARGKIEMLTFLSDLKFLFLRLLKEELPHATFGHTTEKEQLYKANPEMLRQ